VLLSVEGLCVHRGRLTVLEDIDLELGDAELIALVGPNGAGKTTLLRALSGLEAAHCGSVRLFGEDVTYLGPERRAGMGLAHVPEGRRLFGGLSVRENLLLGAWHRRPPDLASVLSWLPELAEILERPARSLGSAEAQLCAIGRALAADPAVLLIDEISLGLSPRAVNRVLDLLTDLISTGVSVLFVEQDAERALAVADRAYVLKAGRIVGRGCPGELLGTEGLDALG
jgi:branched-chain amino acid transport system ATP-binding protein